METLASDPSIKSAKDLLEIFFATSSLYYTPDTPMVNHMESARRGKQGPNLPSCTRCRDSLLSLRRPALS